MYVCIGSIEMSSSIEEVLHNLRSENSQIRTELKAQQAVNSKLRRERDDTLELLQQAKEENGYVLYMCLLVDSIVSVMANVPYFQVQSAQSV